jgi:hypothetical protein
MGGAPRGDTRSDGHGVNDVPLDLTRDEGRTQGKRNRRYEVPVAERETGFLMDYSANVVHVWTYCPAEARDWQRRGYGAFLTIGYSPDGRAISWKGDFPMGAVRPLAKFQDGAVKRRRGHRKGGVLRPRAA